MSARCAAAVPRAWPLLLLVLLAVPGCARHATETASATTLAAEEQDAGVPAPPCIPPAVNELLDACAYHRVGLPEPPNGVTEHECTSKYVTATFEAATALHVEAVGNDIWPGTRDRATIERALRMYDELLASCPDLDRMKLRDYSDRTEPTRYRLFMYRAELFWHMDDWDRAAPAFEAVADMEPGGRYAEDAAYAAVLCYNRIYRRERKKRGGTPESNAGEQLVFQPSEPTELEQSILRSYDRYVCYVKQGEKLANIKYRRARQYYEANRFAEAAVLFKDVAINHSGDRLGVFTATLYLDCLIVLGSMVEKPEPTCYDDLAEAAELFSDTSKSPGVDLMKDEWFAQQMRALERRIEKEREEELRRMGRWRRQEEHWLLREDLL